MAEPGNEPNVVAVLATVSIFRMKGVGQASVGMGLSVSYKIIVESHKGDLSVSSGSESGAIFTISLPIA